MKSKFFTAAILAATMFLGGCAQMQQMIAKEKLDAYAKADTALLQGVYQLSPDGTQEQLTQPLKTAGYQLNNLQADRFTVRKPVVDGKNLQDVVYVFQNRTSIDVTASLPAQEYVKAVKARGNTARLFKTGLSAQLAELVYQPIRHFQGDAKNPASVEWWASAPAIVEYDASGRMVSFMLHVYQAQASIGAGVTEYASIYMGRANVMRAENTIGNIIFKNNYLRDL